MESGMKKILIGVLASSILLDGCVQGRLQGLLPAEGMDEGNAQPENAQESQPPFDGIEELACIPDSASFETAWVTRVIDGDSIEVNLDGESCQVRYIGIDTPEYYSKEQTRAEQAKSANQELVSGKTVYLFRDRSDKDKYERLLRYVATSEVFVNLEMVKSGYAAVKEYHPDTACHETFLQAAQEVQVR